MTAPTGSSSDAPYAAALCRLPGMGPVSLVRVLREGRPLEVWEAIRGGWVVRADAGRGGQAGSGGSAPTAPLVSTAPTVPPASTDEPPALWSGPGPAESGRPASTREQTWADAARRIDPEEWWASRAAQGIEVTWVGAPTYPEALRSDPEPPGVLFWRGSLRWLDAPCVALVGTRRASPDGRAVAFELGRDLASAGVCVVSGLALGIDGAAHAGAVRGAAGGGGAGPVAVVASGVDVAYPRRHAQLWEQVATAGAVVSETLPGSAAEAWRFPVRNRIIAGLSRMVVIVESHAAGGSLITAEAALARGIEVRAVPGPVHSPACAGSNQLLYDGPGPVRNAQDVLDGLGIFRPTPPVAPSSARRPEPAGERPPPPGLGADERAVLEATGWRPSSFSRIVEFAGVPVARAMAALDQLERAGLVGRHGGWWVRTSPR